MVGGSETLIQGGIHLAKLDPAKPSEVGKLRPVILLTGQFMLDKHAELFRSVIPACTYSR
jgi:mRNA-degrading endonuclease toxin of MazEF toxin-antitoxin module